MKDQIWLTAVLLSLSLLLAGCPFTNNISSDDDSETEPEADPAQVTIGERLFLETRFAQFFVENSGGVNEPVMGGGDPKLNDVSGLPGQKGPFAGQSMNCRNCHFVDELFDAEAKTGMRSYADFATRSPNPTRVGLPPTPTTQDLLPTTRRNAEEMVNSMISRPVGLLFHWDGEFANLEDLVIATYTGTDFGWLPGEADEAKAQIVRVIKQDNGQGALAQEFGGFSYAQLLAGDPSLPPEFLLPEAFRIDVTTASDEEIVAAVSKLVVAYVESLTFARDENGYYSGSPYDRFLEVNNLPRGPEAGETAIAYARRLRAAIDALLNPTFVVPGGDNTYATHSSHPFQFGASELAGLRIFLREPANPNGVADAGEIASGGIGNCAACHVPPDFTDFGMHVTGVTQAEYDAVHTAGAFVALHVPDLAERTANPDLYLPATEMHPNRAEPFRRPSQAGQEYADLGAWNIFANDDFPAPQETLRRVLCLIDPTRDENCTTPDAELLGDALAAFKTPTARDLGHSAPFMHNGVFDNLDAVLNRYMNVSGEARDGNVRNADPRLSGIALKPADLEDLLHFLMALDEDYS